MTDEKFMSHEDLIAKAKQLGYVAGVTIRYFKSKYNNDTIIGKGEYDVLGNSVVNSMLIKYEYPKKDRISGENDKYDELWDVSEGWTTIVKTKQPVIKKKQFITIMKAIKAQMKHDHKCNKAFDVILPNDSVVGYDNIILLEGTVNLLKQLLHDKSEWIDYYIWELNFGKEYTKDTVTEQGKPVKLKSIIDLWNLLINNLK